MDENKSGRETMRESEGRESVRTCSDKNSHNVHKVQCTKPQVPLCGGYLLDGNNVCCLLFIRSQCLVYSLMNQAAAKFQEAFSPSMSLDLWRG